jgi:serine/threonine protein kinase
MNPMKALTNTPPEWELGISCVLFIANSRPYRAPELNFAPKDYGGEIDVWSFGCTVAELFTPEYTLFSDGAHDGGLSSDLVLLRSIITTLGTPTSETWPESMCSQDNTDDVAKMFRDWNKIQLTVKPAKSSYHGRHRVLRAGYCRCWRYRQVNALPLLWYIHLKMH